MRRLAEKKAKAVLRFANASKKFRFGSLKFNEVGLRLRHSSVVGHTAFAHGFHHFYVALPQGDGAARSSQLGIEHLERIIEIGHTADDCGLGGLVGCLGQQEVGLGKTAIAADRTPRTEVPVDSQWEGVGLGSLAKVERGDATLRCEGYGGQPFKASNAQAFFGLTDSNLGLLEVKIIGDGLVNEGLQLRLGENFAPRHCAEIDGVGLSRNKLVKTGGIAIERLNLFKRFGSLIVLDNVATYKQQAATKYGKESFHE